MRALHIYLPEKKRITNTYLFTPLSIIFVGVVSFHTFVQGIRVIIGPCRPTVKSLRPLFDSFDL